MKHLVVAERASPESEEELRAPTMDRDQFRADAKHLLAGADGGVDDAQQARPCIVRVVGMAAERIAAERRASDRTAIVPLFTSPDSQMLAAVGRQLPSAGTASADLQFPSATATFRSKPRRFARFTREFLKRRENSSCDIPISSISRGQKASSLVIWTNFGLL